MSPDLPAALPPSAVEAAAEALADTVATAGWIFRGRYPQYEESRERWRDRVRVVLAAALAECEVLEEWIAEVDLGEGLQPRPWVYASAAEVDAYMLAIVKPKRKLRRLVITTKPQPAFPVDTPREETTGE